MQAKLSARDKLLNAAIKLIREHGFTGTTVDMLCAEAGVTKGAFFHHFKSKTDLGIATANYWSDMTGELFRSAPYHAPEAALDRVLAYIDFRADLIAGNVSEFTCVVGTMAQEIHMDAPQIRNACGDSIFGHAETLIEDITLAIEDQGLHPDWDAKSLADHTQAVLQGAFILAKAGGGAEAAKKSVAHLRRYIELLFLGTPSDDR